MKFRMAINMDNGAFEDSGELSDILKKTATHFEFANNQARYGEYDATYTIMDSNGNKVGMAQIVS